MEQNVSYLRFFLEYGLKAMKTTFGEAAMIIAILASFLLNSSSYICCGEVCFALLRLIIGIYAKVFGKVPSDKIIICQMVLTTLTMGIHLLLAYYDDIQILGFWETVSEALKILAKHSLDEVGRSQFLRKIPKDFEPDDDESFPRYTFGGLHVKSRLCYIESSYGHYCIFISAFSMLVNLVYTGFKCFVNIIKSVSCLMNNR